MKIRSCWLVRMVAGILVALVIAARTVLAALDPSPSFPVHIEIQDYGIYRLLDKKEQGFQADTTAGYASVINTSHLKQTEQIALKRGQVFGFNYVITDASTQEAWVPVVIQIKHPATKNYLGNSSVGFSQASAARLKSDGRYYNGAFYIFSEAYEMVPGEWKISVIYREEKIVSQRFIVK